MGAFITLSTAVACILFDAMMEAYSKDRKDDTRLETFMMAYTNCTCPDQARGYKKN